MDAITKHPFQPTYTKESGLYVINIDSIQFPFEVREKSIVSIPPKQIGGNHKHPRIEVFITLTNNLKLIWQNPDGTKQEESMDKRFIYIISPNTPHVVVNISEQESGILLEYADAVQKDTKIVILH